MKILFLQKRLLLPTDNGGKIRTLNVLRYLARWHDVTYLCNVQSADTNHIEEMRSLGVRLETIPWYETRRGSLRFYGELALNLLSRYPYNVNKDYDPRLRERAGQLLASGQYDLVICDFVQTARNAIGLNAHAKILFEHNVESQIFKRHSQADRGWLRRAYMRHQWKKMRRFEAQAGRDFDAVIAVSQQDRETFAAEYDWDHVKVIDTAVDIDYFQPRQGTEQRDRVVFVGSMDWLPNEGGVQHFVKHTWPEILRRRPGATFQIVGRNPPPAVRRLANVAGVEVVGTVPDVRPYLADAAVVVVPLLIGGGTRLKIFEAMSMQKAVVSTPVGAEGLNVTPGAHLLLADAASAFADAVVELLENPSRRDQLGAAARRLVADCYSAERVARQFERICEQTVSDAASHCGNSTALSACPEIRFSRRVVAT